MKSIMDKLNTERLILLRGVLRDGAVGALVNAIEQNSVEEYARAYGSLLSADMENSFAGYLSDLILRSDNLFARRACTAQPNLELCAALKSDLRILQRLAKSAETPPPSVREAQKDGFPAVRYGRDDGLFGTDWGADETIRRLADFYKTNGYGIYIGNKAFTFEDGTLRPVRNTPDVTLNDLKDYAAEKKAVEDNVVNFIEGLPYSNMLLYGDKGTGKSSTVHAMLNKYAEKGLRAVEIPKEQICSINAAKEVLSSLPFKFILFIDDLSLEERDEKVTALKAGLEGSIHERSSNVMIAATSNRRHIVKENFSDRDNSVHARDTMEEQLSLSDRFGLTVCFSSTGKAEYLSIVRQLAADRKLSVSDEELCTLAERWAILKGGRSPRRAKQFVDFAYSCLAKGMPIEF